MQKRNLPIKISMEGIEMVSFSQNPDPSKPQPFIFFYLLNTPHNQDKYFYCKFENIKNERWVHLQ